CVPPDRPAPVQRRDPDHHDPSRVVRRFRRLLITRDATMKLDTSPPRGMRDVLPDEVDLRDRTLATILDVYRRRGFVRIETPAVESLALLTRGEGGENEKLIFKILKRGERLAASRDSEELADHGR